MTPSKPGYQVSTADLQQADLTQEQLGRLIAPYAQSGGTPDITALLAAILKTQSRSSTRFNLYPYNIAGNQMLQILPENPNRTSLIISQSFSTNGVMQVLLEQSGVTPQDLNRSLISRSFPISQPTTGYGTFEFYITPVNAVTLLSLSTNPADRISGVILEGTT